MNFILKINDWLMWYKRIIINNSIKYHKYENRAAKSSKEGKDNDVGRAFKNIWINLNNDNKSGNKSINLAPEIEFALNEKDVPNENKPEIEGNRRNTNNIHSRNNFDYSFI